MVGCGREKTATLQEALGKQLSVLRAAATFLHKRAKKTFGKRWRVWRTWQVTHLGFSGIQWKVWGLGGVDSLSQGVEQSHVEENVEMMGDTGGLSLEETKVGRALSLVELS